MKQVSKSKPSSHTDSHETTIQRQQFFFVFFVANFPYLSDASKELGQVISRQQENHTFSKPIEAYTTDPDSQNPKTCELFCGRYEIDESP